MSDATVPREAPWSAGLRGARAHLLPALVLQGVALAIVAAFYLHAPTHDLLTRLAGFRSEKGLLYSICATALFGGVLPCLYLKLNRPTRHRYSPRQNAFLITFWAYKGIEVDLWYRFLAITVGSEATAGTVATKMFLDQFVYCPVFAVPLTVVVYGWCESGFNTAALAGDIRAPAWYVRRVLPMLISNLGVWLPAVCIIFSLPTTLQLPLFNLVLCFFTLLVAHIAETSKPPSIPPAA